MLKFNPDIFRAYDIRGIYGKDFDEWFAFQLGNKIATALGGPLVIGRDHRTSSEELMMAVVRGAMAAGAAIITLDKSTVPMFYFSVGQHDAKGGIMITASHNPDEYNGFKVVGEQAAFIDGPRIKELYEATEVTEGGQGSITEYNPMDDYIDKVVSIGGSSDSMLSVGCVNAPSLTQELLKKLGQKANLEIFDTPWETALYVNYDTDSDRIWFTDSEMPVEADLLFLLVTEKLGFKRVVHDFRYSKVVKERLNDRGVKSIASPVGRTHIYENMQKLDADFGGELSGHYYFKDFDYLEAPELLLLYVRTIIQQTGNNLPELLKTYHLYRRSGEIVLPLNKKSFSKLEEKYKQAHISKEDGLLIDLWDSEGWWLSLRLSNTEPVMRLVAEAKTDKLLQGKLEEVKRLIQ